MREITNQLDLKVEKLKVISNLLKIVDVDNKEQLTSEMLRELRDEIELTMVTDF